MWGDPYISEIPNLLPLFLFTFYSNAFQGYLTLQNKKASAKTTCVFYPSFPFWSFKIGPREGIDESIFKNVLKYVYVLIPLPNLNSNLIYFELYFEVCAHTYTPTGMAYLIQYVHVLILSRAIAMICSSKVRDRTYKKTSKKTLTHTT